jgi:hypothetical protein
MTNQTIDRVRFLMAPANPVPAHSEAFGLASGVELPGADATLSLILGQSPTGANRAGQPSALWLSRPHRRARRILTPLGAGLAVAGLVTGLTLALGSPQPRARQPAAGASADGTPTPVPRFFVELGLNFNGGTVFAAVHDSQTGKVLSTIQVPDSIGTIPPNIAADGSDRTFIINATRSGTAGNPGVTALYRLRLAADGRSETLTRLPVNLLPAGSNDVVDGIAVSPDGSQLAVGLQLYDRPDGGLSSHGEIALYSLTGGPTQTWTAPGDVPAMPWDPVWISSTKLAFVWQDHLRGSAIYFFTGRSQVRVLDTSAPGHNLLASSDVLLKGGGPLGFIQAAGVGADGSPIDVATFRVTSIGGSGTATMLLAQVSPSGTVIKTFETVTESYYGLKQEGAVTTPCQVIATDATGQHDLAYCPAFGRIDDGTFTQLAHNSDTAIAAW